MHLRLGDHWLPSSVPQGGLMLLATELPCTVGFVRRLSSAWSKLLGYSILALQLETLSGNVRSLRSRSGRSQWVSIELQSSFLQDAGGWAREKRRGLVSRGPTISDDVKFDYPILFQRTRPLVVSCQTSGCAAESGIVTTKACFCLRLHIGTFRRNFGVYESGSKSSCNSIGRGRFRSEQTMLVCSLLRSV